MMRSTRVHLQQGKFCVRWTIAGRSSFWVGGCNHLPSYPRCNGQGGKILTRVRGRLLRAQGSGLRAQGPVLEQATHSLSLSTFPQVWAPQPKTVEPGLSDRRRPNCSIEQRGRCTWIGGVLHVRHRTASSCPGETQKRMKERGRIGGPQSHASTHAVMHAKDLH